MKILVISPEVPMDALKGFQVLSFHRLIHLARRHQIALVTHASEEQKELALERFNSSQITITTVPWKPLKAALRVLAALLDKNKPLQCAAYESREFTSAVRDAVRQFQPDLIYVITIRALGKHVPAARPLVIDLVDSMALNLQRRLPTAPWWQKPFIQLELSRVKLYERRVASSSLCAFVVSKIDKSTIGDEGLVVLPLGVDTLEFHPRPKRSSDHVVTFTGNMSYAPNVDAALWFYRQCWPALSKEFPDLQFVIAGSDPASALTQLRTHKRIHVTGRVDSIAAVLQSSTVAIAPMQSGSGMQFKILEAMACGLPVVTSSVGLGDLAAIDGRHLLVADSAPLFSRAVAKVLSSEVLQAELGREAAQFVSSHHSWDAINELFESKVTASMESMHCLP